MLRFVASLCLLRFSLAGAMILQPPQMLDNMNLASSMLLEDHENLTLSHQSFVNTTMSVVNPAVTCFAQPQPRSTTSDPIDLFDCVSFFPSFLLRPDVLETALWSSSGLPKSIDVRSCRLSVSAKGANARDSFPEVLILQRAALILRACFATSDPARMFGGRVSVGDREQFWVGMYRS